MSEIKREFARGGVVPGGVMFPNEKWEKCLAPKNHVQEGKPRATLLPMDVLIQYLVPAYEEGIIKYRRESWREGFYVSVLIDAALRHIHEFYWKGKDWDASSTELGIEKHHLAGALFSLLSILHTLDTRPELDDRFCKTKEKPLSMEGKDFFLEMEEE